MKLILEVSRGDLFTWQNQKPIKDIELIDFLRPNVDDIHRAHKITFVDDDGKTKILKIRS